MGQMLVSEWNAFRRHSTVPKSCGASHMHSLRFYDAKSLLHAALASCCPNRSCTMLSLEKNCLEIIICSACNYVSRTMNPLTP